MKPEIDEASLHTSKKAAGFAAISESSNARHPARGEAVVHNELGFELKKEGRFTEAIIEFENALELRPNDSFALSNLAHIYFIQNNMEQALYFVEKARKANPKNWFACGVLGDILSKSGDLHRAEAAYEEELALNPKAIYAYINLGIVYRKQKKLDAALAILKQGLEIAPEYFRIHLSLGDVYTNLRQYEQAMASYQRAIDLNPTDQYAFNRWLACQIKEGDAEDAVAQLKKVLSIPSRSQNAHLHALLAFQLKNLKRYEEAIGEFQTAVKLNPNSVYFRKHLAFCYSKNGEYAKARELLEPIYKIRSKDALVAAALIKAYLNLHQHGKAQTTLTEALQHQPRNRYLRMMTEELQRVKHAASLL